MAAKLRKPLALLLPALLAGPAGMPAFVAGPAVEFPLVTGTRWVFELRHETGPGVQFGEQDVPHAKGNLLQTTVISEVAGTDAIGGAQYARVESRKHGRPWLTEWYRVDADGLLLGRTADTDTGAVIDMVPPQRLLSAKMPAGESWTWKARDAPVTMRVRVMGPASVTVPAGTFEGTLMSHDTTIQIEMGQITVRQNRWFVPRMGYVKQETETRQGSRLLGRVTLSLNSFDLSRDVARRDVAILHMSR